MRVLGAVLFFVAVAATADARFADTQGFSGKHGVTCVSCHLPDPVELGTAPTVSLIGLPSSWDPARSYPVRVEVTGGPPGNPAPDTPQAGFDLETDLGALSAGEGMDGALRFPTTQEATYTGVGTFLRSWELVWTSPNLTAPPTDATFWVAAIAANGNHAMTGPNVTGERGDRATQIIVTVPPSDAAVSAWDEQPVPPPTLEPYEPPVPAGPSVLVGSVAEFADGAEYRIDDGEWNGAVGAPGFSIPLLPWTPGDHTVDVRAVWGEHASEATRLSFTAPGDAALAATSGDSPSNVGLWLWLLLLLVFPAIPLLARLRR